MRTSEAIEFSFKQNWRTLSLRARQANQTIATIAGRIATWVVLRLGRNRRRDDFRSRPTIGASHVAHLKVCATARQQAPHGVSVLCDGGDGHGRNARFFHGKPTLDRQCDVADGCDRERRKRSEKIRWRATQGAQQRIPMDAVQRTIARSIGHERLAVSRSWPAAGPRDPDQAPDRPFRTMLLISQWVFGLVCHIPSPYARARDPTAC